MGAAQLAAVADPALFPWGVAVIAVWTLAAWFERKRATRPVTAAAVWSVAMRAPVLPLANHTYLYYLVVPSAGVGIVVGVFLADALRRAGTAVGPALLLLLLGGYTFNEAMQVHARQHLGEESVLVDRVAREGRLLRNALSGLHAAGVVSGDSIVLVNPYPLFSVDPSHAGERAAGEDFSKNAYIPLVAALHRGTAVSLFIPGVTVLGMGDGLPHAWERARVFRFGNDGTLTGLGRGVRALDALAEDYALGERWTDARTVLTRLIELGADGPEVRWRLSEALRHLGDDAGSRAQIRLVLERWPDSPRAEKLRKG